MALWNILGDLLESSGWTSALCEADVASSGVADLFLKASHLTKKACSSGYNFSTDQITRRSMGTSLHFIPL